MMTDKEYQDRLNNFRTEIRLTANDLTIREKAEEMGIHYTSLYRILRGEEPSLRAYLQICEWIADTNSEATEPEENNGFYTVEKTFVRNPENGTKKAKGR